MLDELFSAPGEGAQSVKTTECLGGCGEVIPYRTNAKVYCDACRAERRRSSAREAAERRRRLAGIPKVKGATLTCEECKCSFVSDTGGRVKWCHDCRPAMALKRAREYSYAADKSGTRKRVGRTECCQNCNAPFVVKDKGRFVYCEDCRVLQKANRLPSLRSSMSEWRRKRYREDPKFALNEFMRNGILKALGNGKGGNSWVEFVDYTVDDLKDHLERQFLPGMTWENRGLNGWHIDHIVPISSFSFDGPEHPDFKACWSMTNLRPLWEADNLKKGAERTTLL